MLGKIFGMVTVGSTLASVGLLHRFMMATAQMMILVIICAFLLCASLASVFYIFYFCLVQFGIAPLMAGVALGVVTLLVTIALAVFTSYQLQRLRNMHSRYLSRGNNGIDLSHVAMAFIDGFLNKK